MTCSAMPSLLPRTRALATIAGRRKAGLPPSRAISILNQRLHEHSLQYSRLDRRSKLQYGQIPAGAPPDRQRFGGR